MADRLPCGCIIDTVNETLMMQPCSLTCEYYLYAIEEAARQGKPTDYITL